MTAVKPCPRCKTRNKEPGYGYCMPCYNAYRRARYRKVREEAGHSVYGIDERIEDDTVTEFEPMPEAPQYVPSNVVGFGPGDWAEEPVKDLSEPPEPDSAPVVLGPPLPAVSTSTVALTRDEWKTWGDCAKWTTDQWDRYMELEGNISPDIILRDGG